MSTNITRDITVDFVEKNLIIVDFVEKDLIAVNIRSADIATKNISGLKDVEIENLEDNDVLTYYLDELKWKNKALADIIADEIIYGEVPSNTQSLPSKRFVLANACKTATLRVYFNGLSEKNITIHSNTEFSFGIDIIVGDEITVNYIKD